MLRGSGILWDLRIIDAYENYNLFDFSVPVAQLGDCYDRYLIRLEEMRESLNIMSQCLDFLVDFDNKDDHNYLINDNKIVPPAGAFMKHSMSL